MDRLSLAVEPALPDCVPSPFSSEQLAQARALAVTSGERVLQALGVLCELAPMPFIECLGRTLHYPVLDTDTLFKATPVFDRVTLAQCLKREFMLLRHDDMVIGVFADPFDTARLAWIDDCLHGAPLYLVHADDLKAYLARHEESFHAVESLNAKADTHVERDNL